MPDKVEIGLASGQDFADAMVLSAWAAHQGAPLLLTRSDRVPSPLATWLETHASRITRVHLAGGPAAVSEEVVDQVEAIVGAGTVVRHGGTDRYDTARLVALNLFDAPDAAIVASGNNWPDAITGASLAALHPSGAPLLLTRSPNWDQAVNSDDVDDDPNNCQEGQPCDPALHSAAVAYLDHANADSVTVAYVLGRIAALGPATHEDVNCLVAGQRPGCEPPRR